jgi:hypothetical protein
VTTGRAIAELRRLRAALTRRSARAGGGAENAALSEAEEPSTPDTEIIIGKQGSRRAASAGRVLVAEPDAARRGEIAAALRADCYEVVESDNGAELLLRAGEMMARLDAPRHSVVIVAGSQTPIFAGEELIAVLGRLGWNIPLVLVKNGDPDAAEAPSAAAVLGGTLDPECLRAAVRAAAGR